MVSLFQPAPSPDEPDQAQQPPKGKQTAQGRITQAAQTLAFVGKQVGKNAAGFLLAFRARLKQDETTRLAAMLAYYLLMSIVPLLVVLLSFIGIVIGSLSPQAHDGLVAKLTGSTPISKMFINAALEKLAKGSGFLALGSILVSVFSGTRLFLNIEYCFSKIYRLPLRPAWRQWLVALIMLAVFIVALPLLLAVSSLPSILATELVTRLFGHSPATTFLLSLISLLVSLLLASALFLAIYVVVPNTRLRLRDAWRGALLAGALLVIYSLAMPFYVTHYLGAGSTGATAGFALLVLVLFYYFGLILLLGAELNALAIERHQATQL